MHRSTFYTDTNSHFSCKITLSIGNGTLHLIRWIQLNSNQKSKITRSGDKGELNSIHQISMQLVSTGLNQIDQFENEQWFTIPVFLAFFVNK